MLTLFYSPGTCSLACHISLVEAGLTFRLEKVELESGSLESGENWKQINPKGYVPALRLDNGELFTEGPALQQIIADLAPDGKILPPPRSMERYRALEWLSYLSSELHVSFAPLFKGAADADKDAARKRIAGKLRPAEEWFGKANEWLAKHWSGADAYLFVLLSWTASDKVKIDLSPFPQLVSFMERMKQRPSVQQAMKAEGLSAGTEKEAGNKEGEARAQDLATRKTRSRSGAEAEQVQAEGEAEAAAQGAARQPQSKKEDAEPDEASAAE